MGKVQNAITVDAKAIGNTIGAIGGVVDDKLDAKDNEAKANADIEAKDKEWNENKKELDNKKIEYENIKSNEDKELKKIEEEYKKKTEKRNEKGQFKAYKKALEEKEARINEVKKTRQDFETQMNDLKGRMDKWHTLDSEGKLVNGVEREEAIKNRDKLSDIANSRFPNLTQLKYNMREVFKKKEDK